ncbi:MAG TPA: protein kinase, partial [Pyrinomonadaceae bacterium]|nr:protein kinase [Pyrinomonadaceae bacterium]
ELKLQQTRLDGRYDIVECLGRGSYAEIYVARDEAAAIGAPQMVVIKALNVSLQGPVDPELEHTLIDNFRNEAVALDRVRHPNVINRLGHGTAIDLAGLTFHYLVLEYLPGGDVATLCRKNPLPLERALYYLEQVCAGLTHAHEHDVIHRDIKPQNLLLTADCETVKIADFGIAKIEALEGAITRVGTDIYAAPEHHPLRQTGPLDTAALSSAPAHLTPAADIYSLAKTAYMMLTGEAPRRFSQQPISELPAPVAGEPWASFVLSVLRRATETNPLKRYQSVPEFWAELRDAAMPQTRLLVMPTGDEARPRTQPLPALREEELPPRPQPAEFEARQREPRKPVEARPATGFAPRSDAPVRPRIVVPVTLPQTLEQKPAAAAVAPAPLQKPAPPARSEPARAELAQKAEVRAPLVERLVPANRMHRWLVVLLLLAGFALLLLGTHAYVSNRTHTSAQPVAQPPNNAPANVNLQTGREMTTMTNVNLRTGPSKTYPKIGEAEQGSRVRVLQCSGSWCEVQVLEHGQPRADEGNADQGWLDATKLR